MPKTYTPITTLTINNSTTTTLDFTSIPQTYTDLVLVCSYGLSGGDLYFRLNNDGGTGNLYSDLEIYGNGATAGVSALSNRSGYYLNDQGITRPGPATVSIVNFLNYTNTTTYKNVLWRSSDSGVSVEAHVGSWRNTAAITSINFIMINVSGTITPGSQFTLYGIKAA
jgi:hypothetical protein